jgi:hypothetical protein
MISLLDMFPALEGTLETWNQVIVCFLVEVIKAAFWLPSGMNTRCLCILLSPVCILKSSNQYAHIQDPGVHRRTLRHYHPRASPLSVAEACLYSSSCDIYPSLHIAKLWNKYRTLRTKVLRIVLTCQRVTCPLPMTQTQPMSTQQK